ncbi:MAG: hypothetical protein U0167_11115 [bacterium]
MNRAALTTCCLFVLVASPAAAHRGWVYRPPRMYPPPPPREMYPPPAGERSSLETYTAFKVGGYAPDALTSSDQGGGGLYLGGEWGISPAPPLELGFTVDWFHRDRQRGEIVTLDGPYDLPVQIITGEDTSTDLVPLGGVVRARFPVGDGRLAPFVAGHLSLDVLHLDAQGASFDGPAAALQDTHWFAGFGTGISTGVEANLAPGFGLLVEAGLHNSEPGRHLRIDGMPAEARVQAGGDYLRAGARFAF